MKTITMMKRVDKSPANKYDITPYELAEIMCYDGFFEYSSHDALTAYWLSAHYCTDE
jgi:hypothetical protein